MTQERMKSLEIGFGTERERERETHTHMKKSQAVVAAREKKEKKAALVLRVMVQGAASFCILHKLLNDRASIIMHGLLEPSSEFHSCNKAVLDKRLVEGRESHC
jgi:hypothetical protein